MKQLFFTILVLVTLCSCSSSKEIKPPEVRDVKIGRIELYLGRASINAAEFEQFKVMKNKLFFECGKVHKGRFTPIYQNIVSLNEEKKNELKEISSKIVFSLEDSNYEFDKQEDGVHFYDAGKFQLSINTEKKAHVIKTSFDSVADGEKTPLLDLKTLAQKLRSFAGKRLCENKDFYGLYR